MVLLSAPTPAWADQLRVVGSFETPEIPFPATSIAVDTDRGTLLLGGPDGSINEFTRSGFFLESVVPAGLVDGIRSSSDRGLVYVPIPEPRIYSSGGRSYTGLFSFSRSGVYQDARGLFGSQHFEGLYFESHESSGVLYILESVQSRLYAFTFTEVREFVGPWFQLYWDMPYEEWRELTGVVGLAERGVFIVSLEHAQLLILVPENLSPAHGDYVSCEIAGRVDLREVGIQTVHDLAHDPVTHSLYVTDGQGKVFELAFTSSAPFHRGDTDGSGSLNVTDAVRILDFLFLGGAGFECLAASDGNGDRRLDVADAVFLLRFLLGGGPAPPAPGPPGSPCGEEFVLGFGVRELPWLPR